MNELDKIEWAAPLLPPPGEEVVKELVAMVREKNARIAELQRKLAEQQHLLTIHAIYSGDSGLESYLSNSGGREELNNLLAKAKEEGRRGVRRVHRR